MDQGAGLEEEEKVEYWEDAPACVYVSPFGLLYNIHW